VSRSGEILDMAADMNLVQKSGAWFSVDGERIGQGRDNARTYLEQHPALLDKLEQKVLAAAGIQRPGEAAPTPTPTPEAPSGKGEAEPSRATPNGSAKAPRGPQPARPS